MGMAMKSYNAVTSRRSLLTAGAAIGLASLFPHLMRAAQGAGVDARRIDVHHHFQPDNYLAYAQAHPKAGNDVKRNWFLSKDIEDMDKSGIATAILSMTTAGGGSAFWFGEREENRMAIRQCNEAAAKLRADHPGRFGSFAAVPMDDVDGALKEIEYAMDTLKADGLGIFTNYGENKWLGDDMYDPIWEEANRRGLVVYTHPCTAACCGGVGGPAPTLVEYGADTTRSIAHLIQNGKTSKYPNIKFIFSHGGGAMPYLIERFLVGSAEEVVPGIVTKGQGGTGVLHSGYSSKAPNGMLNELRRLYYDTAQASNPIAMDALKKVAGVSQIVFGTDYWYRTAEETVNGMTKNKVFSAEELRMIDRGNAERLLPKYKSL